MNDQTIVIVVLACTQVVSFLLLLVLYWYCNYLAGNIKKLSQAFQDYATSMGIIFTAIAVPPPPGDRLKAAAANSTKGMQ